MKLTLPIFNPVLQFCAKWVKRIRFIRFNPALMSELFRSVKDAESNLAFEKNKIGSQYLEVANSLERVVTNGGDLVKQCEALTDIDSGTDGINATAQEIQDLVAPALLEVDRVSERMQSLVRELHTLQKELKKILEKDSRLQETLEPMKYIQTLIRVECAHYPHDIQEKFESLVGEIVQANQVFSKLFPQLTGIGSLVEEVSIQIATRTEEQNLILESQRSKIEKTLSKIFGNIDSQQKRNSQMVDYSGVIRNRTANVVMALQCQDAFSQKLEHVEKALHEIEVRINNIVSTNDLNTRENDLCYVQQAGLVVVAQIAAIQDDIANSESEITSNLESILEGSSQFQSEMESTENDDTTVRQNLGEVLGQAIEDATNLLKDISNCSDDSRIAMESILKMTDGLSESLLDISVEIHLIGLNSQVKSAHLGQGTALDTLSARTSEIAISISEQTKEIALEVEVFVQSMRNAITETVRVRESSVEPLNRLSNSGNQQLNSLNRNYTQSLGIIENIRSTTRTLNSESNDAIVASQVSELSQSALVRLQACVNSLTEFTNKTINRCGVSMDSSDQINQFLDSYTMQSERQTHLAAMGMTDPANDLFEDASSEENILFFEDEPSTQETSRLDEVESFDKSFESVESKNDGIELF